MCVPSSSLPKRRGLARAVLTVWGLACGSLLALPGCEGDVHKDIHEQIYVLVTRQDLWADKAARALESHGLRALPQIETALHTARPEGRARLVEVLARIEHPDSAHLLRHVTLHDVDPRVRTLGERTLKAFARAGAHPQLAREASQALAWVVQERELGDTPLVREADPPPRTP
ncbi:MAG: hypothetical protein KA712_02900 [Myxococcales bacterium]|nr:hypothetical protein [Myxococcales bacterium]